LLNLAACGLERDVLCALLQVFKGRWHSSDVAIKIITVRTPEELPKVLREAEVMMKLDHTNVVRAFHASVWNPTEQVRTSCVSRVLCYSAALVSVVYFRLLPSRFAYRAAT
jgi:hypothetical protein